MNAFTTAPWLRAPVLLLRRPVVFVAIMAAAAILAVAAASGPLFLSTVGTASLNSQAEQTCPENSRPGLLATVRNGSEVAPAARTLAAAMTARGLARPTVVTIGETQVRGELVHVFSGPGALRHVTKLTSSAGAGAWVPDTFAATHGLRPGGSFTTSNGSVRVAGIYRDLAPDPFELANIPRYFCSWSDAIVQKVASETAPAASSKALTPAPFLIADQATVARVADEPRLALHSPMSTTANALGAFDTAMRATRSAAQARVTGTTVAVDDALPGLIERARTARGGISGSVLPIEIAGVVIAGLLVGGAGIFWANARGREIRLLVARGVGPLPLGAKAVLETLPAAVVGALIGWGATTFLVRAVGPASVLEDGAPLQSLAVVGGVLALGLLLIALIGGLAGRERSAGRRASWVRRVPWELALIAGALAIALGKLDQSAVTVRRAIVDISPLVILYPLLGVTGMLLLLGRLVGLLLPSAGRRAGRGPTAWYLALRRMSRSRAIAVGLIVGTALPCCLLMYAATVRHSVEDEVSAKYRSNLGAPHVLQVYGVRGALFDLDGDGAQVVRYEQHTSVDGESATVMGVDTDTFARFAFLTGSQRSELSRIRAGSADGVPAIVANGGDTRGSRLTIGTSSLRIDTVARPAVFPGLRDGSSPLVVVDQRSLDRIDNNATERTNQVWTDSVHYGAARRIIAKLRYSVLFELTSKVVIDTTGLLPVTWIFGYLQALAVLIGVVAIAGLVFGLASRTRTRRVSYVLSRRMGMSRAAHVKSLLVELTLVLGLGWVAGSALGIGSFRLILEKLDVYPRLPPPPAFAVPVAPVVVSAAVVVAAIVLATLATQALAQRTKPAEILRLE